MAKQDDYVRYTIRVPADLYEKVRAAAGDKSVNAEIIARLEASFAEPQKNAGLGPIIESIAREEYRKLSERIEGIEAMLKDIERSKP